MESLPSSDILSSSEATAVNTAVHTRRNSISVLPATPPPFAPDSVGGVSPRCLAQRLLEQQSSKSAHHLPEQHTLDTSPNTLVANTPRASIDGKRPDKLVCDLEKAVLLNDVVPDGGLQAWLVVAGTFLMIMTNFGLLTSYGIFQAYYTSHQLAHLSASTVSWIGSLQTFCILGGSFLFGKLSDDYGARWILVSGSVLTLCSLLGVSFCSSLVELLFVQGILFGVGGSMLFLPACTLVNQYFDKRRGVAMGIIIGAASFGGIVWHLVLQTLFSSPRIGFAWGTRAAALGLAGLLTISNLLMRPRILPNNRRPGASIVPWRKAVNVFSGDRIYTAFAIGVAVIFINFFVPFFTIASYAKRAGFDANTASHCVAIMNAASMVGRLAAGPLADRWGRFNSMCIYGFLSSLTLLFCWPMPGLTQTKAGVLVFSITYGIFAGGSIAIVGACVGQISSRNQAGARLGMLWTLAAPGTLLGPVLSTLLLNQAAGQYWPLALWTGGATLLGTVVVSQTRFKLAKGKLFVIV